MQVPLLDLKAQYATIKDDDLALPVYPELSNEMKDYVVESVLEVEKA